MVVLPDVDVVRPRLPEALVLHVGLNLWNRSFHFSSSKLERFWRLLA